MQFCFVARGAQSFHRESNLIVKFSIETNKPNQICIFFGADRTPINRSTLETNSIETKALNINVNAFVNPKKIKKIKIKTEEI